MRNKQYGRFCGMSSGPWVWGMVSKKSDLAGSSENTLLLWIIFYTPQLRQCFILSLQPLFLLPSASSTAYGLSRWCSHHNRFFLALDIWSTHFLLSLIKLSIELITAFWREKKNDVSLYFWLQCLDCDWAYSWPLVLVEHFLLETAWWLNAGIWDRRAKFKTQLC